MSQVKDLEFHVSDTLAGLDDSAALFAARPGLPTQRPEVFTKEQPIQGQYVRVQMQKADNTSYLCFIEIEVFGEGKNGRSSYRNTCLCLASLIPDHFYWHTF